LTNEELLKALREIQGGAVDKNQGAVESFPIPAELLPGAPVDPVTRGKILDLYTASLDPTRLSAAQRELYQEQIDRVLKESGFTR